MTLFWLFAGVAAAVSALLILALARRAEALPETRETGVAQLAELERLRERGLIDDEAHAAARAEAARALLAAGSQLRAVAPVPSDRRWALGAAAATAALALAIYLGTGSPGAGDQPYGRRVDDWSRNLEALEPAQLAAVTARVVRENPGDHRALTMLGVARFEAGDPLGAASAFRRALAIQPDDAQGWARLGESLVRSADGVVTAEAEAAFSRSLELDPDQLGARYFLGELAESRGDAAGMRAMWAPLIEALDPADPRRRGLEARLEAAP